MEQRTIKKATLLDLVANAIPANNPLKPLILEKIDQMIPSEEEAEFLANINDPRIKKVVAIYQAYSDKPKTRIQIGDAIDWFKKDSKKAIRDMERRLGEIEAILEVFGDVDPDKYVQVPGSVIIDIRFNTASPQTDLEE